MKILVLYYSLTGNTEKIARAIASKSGAQIQRIEDVQSRTNALAPLRTLFEVIFKRQSDIRPIDMDPSQFDLVVLGAPVWMLSLPPPMRTYIANNKTRLKKVAFFCTEGASGGERIFKSMAALSGQQPLATLEVSEADLRSDAYTEQLNAFNRSIGLVFDSHHVRG